MKRGDLGQLRTGAPGHPDQPGRGGREPAIAGDDALREQSAAGQHQDEGGRGAAAPEQAASQPGLSQPGHRRQPASWPARSRPAR